MSNSEPAMPRCMVVIPTLNEEAHIAALIDRLLPAAERFDMTIVVADGGSVDATADIVRTIALSQPRVRLLDNPRKLQAAALNLAVTRFGERFDCVIRIDAHGDYPEDYCDRLIEDFIATGADSVTVSMITRGEGPFQKATAIAQNSPLGNGGSKHRAGAVGHWTDHGHHALMRIAAFRAVGGYDESFSHNEDAELDFRLRHAGYRIWMTDKTVMTYYPRAHVLPLFRQYLGYGRGRAKNILKHRARPKLRQVVPMMVLPVVAGTSLAVIHALAFLPALAWIGACLAYGAWIAIRERTPLGPLAAISAMVMHLAWSIGFWLQLIGIGRRAAPNANGATEGLIR